MLGLSQRQLHRQFIKSFGCSPQNWLREERLQVALQMLVGATPSSLTVKEVAFVLSFKHPSQFSRDFKARFGCTPSRLLETRLAVSTIERPPTLQGRTTLVGHGTAHDPKDDHALSA
jgi:AraC-like DNA-binding protein